MIFEKLNIRSLEPTINTTNLGLLAQSFGYAGLRYFIANYKGRGVVGNNDKSIIDDIFFRNMRLELGQQFDQGAYMKAMTKAVETHQYIVDILGLPTMDTSVLNEVFACSDSPAERLELISNPNVSELLRYQLSEQMILGLISSGIDYRTRNQRMMSQLYTLVKTINDNLFPGVIGTTTSVPIFSTHDRCNHVERITHGPVMQMRNDENHQKYTVLRIRKAMIGGKSYDIVFDIRKKDDKAAIIKALEKAIHKNKGKIDFQQDVVDMVGIKFIIVNGNVGDFIDAFENILTSSF